MLAGVPSAERGGRLHAKVFLGRGHGLRQSESDASVGCDRFSVAWPRLRSPRYRRDRTRSQRTREGSRRQAVIVPFATALRNVFFSTQTSRNALTSAVGTIHLCQKRRPDNFRTASFA